MCVCCAGAPGQDGEGGESEGGPQVTRGQPARLQAAPADYLKLSSAPSLSGRPLQLITSPPLLPIPLTHSCCQTDKNHFRSFLLHNIIIIIQMLLLCIHCVVVVVVCALCCGVQLFVSLALQTSHDHLHRLTRRRVAVLGKPLRALGILIPCSSSL